MAEVMTWWCLVGGVIFFVSSFVLPEHEMNLVLSDMAPAAETQADEEAADDGRPLAGAAPMPIEGSSSPSADAKAD